MNKKRIIRVFMVVCVLVMIYSIYNIITWYLDNRKNDSIKEEINEIIDNNDDVIDFKTLREKNSDVVAYLKVNNTKIDYVVVKGIDNKFYLKHNLYKEYNKSGWIFMDYHNRLDGTDKNIVIYGHNTRSGNMFGTLKNIITKEWYENTINHTINLVMEDKTFKYQVFSTYAIKVEDYYINTIFKNNDEFNKFVNTLRKRSVYDYGVEVNGEDSILTLSTCTGNGKSRMVLHARLINE